MKPLLIAACLASLSLPQIAAGQAECQATIAPTVEVAPGKLSLADLLSTDACPALLQAAAQVRLGSAPSSGSVRVLPGDEVRALLQTIAGGSENRRSRFTILSVPARITVRRAGARAACIDIGAQLLASLEAQPALHSLRADAGHPVKSAAGAVLRGAVDCGASGRIPREAALQVTKTVWDPALRSWEVSARCVYPGDCVPFLIRRRDRDDTSPGNLSVLSPDSLRWTRPNDPRYSTPGDGHAGGIKPASVKPGQKATLVWEQDGFRVVLRVICLDRGRRGESVRARVENSDRILRAEVVGEGSLRVTP